MQKNLLFTIIMLTVINTAYATTDNKEVLSNNNNKIVPGINSCPDVKDIEEEQYGIRINYYAIIGEKKWTGFNDQTKLGDLERMNFTLNNVEIGDDDRVSCLYKSGLKKSMNLVMSYHIIDKPTNIRPWKKSLVYGAKLYTCKEPDLTTCTFK